MVIPSPRGGVESLIWGFLLLLSQIYENKEVLLVCSLGKGFGQLWISPFYHCCALITKECKGDFPQSMYEHKVIVMKVFLIYL